MDALFALAKGLRGHQLFFGGRLFGILFIYVLLCFVSRFDSHIRVCLYCYRCQCKDRRVSRGGNLVTWKCTEPAQ